MPEYVNYNDYITAIQWGVPLITMGGEPYRQHANVLIDTNGSSPFFLNTLITYEYDFGNYVNYFNHPYSIELFRLPVPFEAPNHVMAEKLKFVKESGTEVGYLNYYDLNDNSTEQGETIIINEGVFAEYCGINVQGIMVANPDTTFKLVLCAGSYNIGISEYEIGFGVCAEISADGHAAHPVSAGMDYFINSSVGGFTQEVMHAQFDGVYYDPEQAVPTGGTDGGGGLFARPDEEIPIPALPSLSVCDTNFISLYKVDAAELASLANYLWSSSFFDNIIKNWQSPMENIISLGIVNYPLHGTLQTVVIGNVSSGIQGEKLSSTFFEIDCGNKDITKYYGNFADYDTEISLYLPYIGNVKIDPSDCMRGVINVVYHIDVFTGSATAYVRCRTRGAWHVLYQYNGQIKVELPITGRSFIESYKAVLGAVGSAASGNIMGVASSALNVKPTYQRSGNAGATSGYMGVQYPYITFSTPQLIQGRNFRTLKGYVSNLTVKIGDVSGFISADINNSDMIGIPDATNEELEMIKQLLADGIYIE
jgi:hypothetical protein